MPMAVMSDLAGGSAAENAVMVTHLLEGERGPRRDVVLFNAAAALLVAGRASSMAEGVSLAATSVDTGRAAGALAAMIEVSKS